MAEIIVKLVENSVGLMKENPIYNDLHNHTSLRLDIPAINSSNKTTHCLFASLQIGRHEVGKNLHFERGLEIYTIIIFYIKSFMLSWNCI